MSPREDAQKIAMAHCRAFTIDSGEHPPSPCHLCEPYACAIQDEKDHYEAEREVRADADRAYQEVTDELRLLRERIVTAHAMYATQRTHCLNKSYHDECKDCRLDRSAVFALADLLETS